MKYLYKTLALSLIVVFYLPFIVTCSWEAKDTIRIPNSRPNPTPTPRPSPTPAPKPSPTPAPKPSPTPAPKPSPTLTPTPSSTPTPTSSATFSSHPSGVFVTKVLQQTSNTKQSFCNKNQKQPHYKEVNGQCLPSCKERLKENLKRSGVVLGRGELCHHPLATSAIEEIIPEEEIYENESCCSVRCIESNLDDANIESPDCQVVEERNHVQCLKDHQNNRLEGCQLLSKEDNKGIHYTSKHN